MEQFNETENALKYGAKESDVISQIFAVSEKAGIAFCIGNALKYHTRFNSESKKAKNPADFHKTFDYIDRAKNKCSSIVLLEKIIALETLNAPSFKEKCLNILSLC